MKLPIRILLGELPEPTQGETWGDIINNWESYALEWNEISNLSVSPNESPVLDMFGDESVTLKDVVKDVSDPKKLFTAYSRSFTVPASKKNNRIFKHYYNVEIVNGLDSRQLIPAKILMNNTTYKIGNIRVDSIKMANGVATSYKLVFIGKLSELAKKIGDDKLSALDWSEYNNENFDFVTQVTNTTVRDVIFPIASKSDRLLADSGTASLGIDKARNIAHSSTALFEDYGLREADIVGALRVGAILDKIADTYGLTFSGAFDFDYITELRLWLQKTERDSQTKSIYNFDGFTLSSGSTDDFVVSNSVIYYQPTDFYQPNEIHRNFYVYVTANYTGDTTVRMIVNGNEGAELASSGTEQLMSIINTSNNRQLRFEVESDTPQAINLTIRIQETWYEREAYITGFGNTSYRHVKQTAPSFNITGSATVGTATTYSVANNMPSLKVIDFLSILFKKFNLIAEVDNSLDIYAEHYDYFLSKGVKRDITKYVDISGYEVKRPNLFSSLNLKYSEAKTALEIGYESVNSKGYGELEYTLTGAQGDRLSGSQYVVDIKSQLIPLEPLKDLNTGNDFKLAYTLFSDLNGSEQSVDASFTYAHKDTISYGFPTIALRTSSTTQAVSEYFQPTNSYTLNYGISVGIFDVLSQAFSTELNELLPAASNVGIGLWNSFYRGITALMFSEDRRRVTYKAYLPQGLLIDLKLSDTLIVSGKPHVINSIETNYLTGESKLDLMMLRDSVNPELDTTPLTVTNNSATDSTLITWLDNQTGEIDAHLLFPSQSTDITPVGGVIGTTNTADISEVVTP